MASAATTISNDVLPKHPSQSLTNGLNKMKETLELNRHIKNQIEQLTNNFMDVYLNFQKDISQSSTNDPVLEPYIEPIQSLDFNFLNDHQTHERIQLALCGPNSSGKTTFLHSFLKINNILPVGVGPITARIVKFTYTTLSNACMIVYPSIEDAFSVNHQEEYKLSLAKYFNDSTTDWKGIEEAIKVHIIRPDVNTEEFNDWVKKFIEIQIPSPTLELGIDVYDTPGLLFHDQPILKDNLQELVHRVRPTLVFLYANSSFAKDANECYLMVRSALSDLEQPSIFYLNTKQDVTTLFNDAGITAKQYNVTKFHEIFPNERLKRYQLLYKVIGVANNLPIIENNASIEIFNSKCDNFDICSIAGRRSLLQDCATGMTEQASQRILEFALKSEVKKSYEIADSILLTIENIINFVALTSHRTKEQWDIIHSNAEIWGEKFFQKFQNEISKISEKINEKIIQRFDEHTNNIIERAIKLERSDDPLHHKTIDIVKKNIKDFIRIAVQEEVVRVVVNEVVNGAKNKLQLLVRHEILISIEKNELLAVAQRQVLIDISSDDIIQRGIIENILFQLSIAPSSLLRLIRGLSTIAQGNFNQLNQTDLTTDKKSYEKLHTMDLFSMLSDELQRREFATEYLRRRRSKFTVKKDLYNQNLQLWIENKTKMFNKNIQKNYHLALSHLTNRNKTYELTHKYIKRFAEVECKLLAVKDLAKFNGQHPVIDESKELGHGTHFVVYPADWSTEKNLVVKKLKQSSNECAYIQYLEAHNHRKVTQLRLIIPSEREDEPPEIRTPHIVPLLHLYESQGNDNQILLYMFLPRYSQSLEKYLQDNINKIKADQVIQIAFDIANVLVLLHANEIVHRDIKANNILMDVNEQCYLGDFGTTREWTTNSTILGTRPLPPEFNPGSLYDGMAADIHSFGILLYELLPKQCYYRPDIIINVKELLKSTRQLNEYSHTYENLIESCLQSEPKDRPNATEVKAELLKCLKELEQKPCTICEENLRKWRFQPCRHKLVCEQCFNKLPRHPENKLNCILCREIIDRWTEDDNNQTFFQ